MLVLVLLAGIVPFSALSASHECSMACCVGKPPHMAGSCSAAFVSEGQAEPSAEPGEEDSAHDGHMAHSQGATSQAVASIEHHAPAGLSSSHHPKSARKESPRTRSVAAQAITMPCSPECAAASAFSQVRRPRDPALISIAARPRPPTRRLFIGRFTAPLPKSAEVRRLSRPRAPPHLLDNLSA
jgi:hypothetical protein